MALFKQKAFKKIKCINWNKFYILYFFKYALFIPSKAIKYNPYPTIHSRVRPRGAGTAHNPLPWRSFSGDSSAINELFTDTVADALWHAAIPTPNRVCPLSTL
jgi:hypothetical protein